MEKSSTFIVILLSIIFLSVTNGKDIIEAYRDGLLEFQQSRIITEQHHEVLNELHRMQATGALKGSALCNLCYFGAEALIFEWRHNVSIDVIALEAIGVCTLFGIETSEVCKGVIDRNIDIFDYIIRANPKLEGSRICSVILQNDGCDKTVFEWSVDIPEGETVQRKNPSNPESSFNILHISDVHYNLLYTEGKLKNCDEPLCCQHDQPDGNAEEGTACGHWSEYEKADSSEALVDESIRKAAEFKFDYVYFTGDAVSHRVWETSIESNKATMKSLFGKMKRAFKDVPIYTALGNHEPTPLNEFAIGDSVDEKVSSQWLYRYLTTEFSQWLPKEAKRTIMQGGYYTVLLREGLRLIVINSNVAYTMNWWLIHDDVDPFGQLAWLAKTLKTAEDANEVVHILSHIPSGKSDLLRVWSREYKRVINRFSGTIGAQFNGHTHHDQFMVFYSFKNTSEVTSIAINGASVMSDRSNPSFRILNIDQSNFDVLDTDEWTFNLTEANLNGNKTPNWYKLYNFREQYGVSSLSPSVFTEFMPRLAANHSLLYDYHILRYRNSDLAQSGCDDSCKSDYLCEIAVDVVGDTTQCKVLQKIFDRS